MKKYLNYSSVDFSADRNFQDWVLNGADKNFWEEFCRLYPNKKTEVEEAVTLLLSIEFKIDKPGEGVVDKRLQEALQIINAGRKRRIFFMRRWGWAAASILLLVFGYWLYSTDRTSRSAEVAIVSEFVPERLEKDRGTPVLTLADGTEIELDSFNNGELTRQGNAIIVKSNTGELVYKTGHSGDGEILYNNIRIPAGSTYQLKLSDGTKVWLNAMTSLRFPASFSGKERRVQLEGEGYFEVSSDKLKPFVVETPDMGIKVFGTSFNVKAYAKDERPEATLIEGSVSVESNGKLAMLKPGQQAQLSRRGIDVINNADISGITAWRNGYFQFNNAGLEAILKELSRWYDADIIYEGSVADLFSGTFPRDADIKTVLQVLEATNKVQFKVVGKQIFVKSISSPTQSQKH